MRPFATLAALLALLASGGSALAASSRADVLVFKTVPLVVADDPLVAPAKPVSGEPGSSDECRDPSYTFAGPRWKTFEPYYVNVESAPAGLDQVELLDDVVAAHEAWEAPFTTDCPRPKGQSKYESIFGGVTTLGASLVAGTADGVNAVAFLSLHNTKCDGAIACVVIDYDEKGRIREADMAFEADLRRFGGRYFWTTQDNVWFDAAGTHVPVIDVATHEAGHFAGLGHADGSPALTMFPYVDDGAQTLGLGDMLGILDLY